MIRFHSFYGQWHNFHYYWRDILYYDADKLITFVKGFFTPQNLHHSCFTLIGDEELVVDREDKNMTCLTLTKIKSS